MTLRIKKIMPITLVAIMIMATFGMAGVSAAGQGAYGSQVEICDIDDTYILTLPIVPTVGWIDNAPFGIFGGNDQVYLDMDNTGDVSTEDIRLLAMPDYAVGSQVQQFDDDEGLLIAAPPVGWDLKYGDYNTGAGYDLSDPVYFAPGAVLIDNALRISEWQGIPAGRITKLNDDDVIVATPLTAMANAYSYYDVNGNGRYDQGDHVILDADVDFLGSVNDVRLTPFDACSEYYPTGEKIESARLDTVHVTTNIGGIQFGYVEVDSNPGYTAGDNVYIDINANNIVDQNDVRLTPSVGKAAGTQCDPAETDNGDPLIIPVGVIQFFDISGDGYTLEDPVYYDVMNSGTVSVNDVVISQGIPSSGESLPGTKVTVTSPFNTEGLTPMPTGIFINYFDTNGDDEYGRSDYVFLHISIASDSSVNNVRLSKDTFGTFPFGSKVLPTDNCCVDGLTPILQPGDNTLRSHDMNGNGISADDIVYLVTQGGGAWNVLENWIRLTPADNGIEFYPAGSVVAIGNFDRLLTTDPIPMDQVRYCDIDSPHNGLTPNDPILIDWDDNNVISAFDVRLKPYASFAAGSKVINDGSDTYYGDALTDFPTGYGFGFVDVNDRGGNFDPDDYAYIDLYGDGFASTNDVRITGEIPTITDWCDHYDQAANGGNNNGVTEISEAWNAILDYQAGTLSINDAWAVIQCYLADRP